MLGRSVRTSQPQGSGSSRIDWSNPITRGLVASAIPANFSGAKLSTPNGVASAGLSCFVNASAGFTKGTVVAGLYRLPSAPNVNNIGWLYAINEGAVYSSNYEYLGNISTGTSGAAKRVFVRNDVTNITSGTVPQSGQFATERLVFDASVNSASAFAQSFRNGALDHTFTSGGAFPWNSQKNRYVVAGAPQIGIYALYLYAWNRALSDAEIKSLSDNPWQIFAPDTKSLWAPSIVAAGGAATVIPIGVQATGSVGTPSATGAATTTPAGVSASSAVGTPIAVGGASIPATVLPAGVQATAAIGTVSARGAALAQPAGVTATGAVGAPSAVAGTSIPATVLPAGVQAASAVGTPTVTAAAIAQPLGVAAIAYVGTPTIATGVSGVAVAYPAGVAAIGQVGTLIATGAAWTAAVGVQAVASVGKPTAYVGEIVIYTAGAQTRPSRLQDSVRFERVHGNRPGRMQSGSRASR